MTDTEEDVEQSPMVAGRTLLGASATEFYGSRKIGVNRFGFSGARLATREKAGIAGFYNLSPRRHAGCSDV